MNLALVQEQGGILLHIHRKMTVNLLIFMLFLSISSLISDSWTETFSQIFVTRCVVHPTWRTGLSASGSLHTKASESRGSGYIIISGEKAAEEEVWMGTRGHDGIRGLYRGGAGD